jgi:hypothetical protein
MWRVGRAGPRFADYQLAVQYLHKSFGVSPAPRGVARKSVNTGPWRKTIYKGVLRRGSVFRVKKFNEHIGYATSLQAAADMIVNRFKHRGITLQSLQDLQLETPQAQTKSSSQETPAPVIRSGVRLRGKEAVSPLVFLQAPKFYLEQGGAFQQLSREHLLRHFSSCWAVYRDHRLQPADRTCMVRALQGPHQDLLRYRVELVLIYLGLKFGPWREEFLRACVAAESQGGFCGWADWERHWQKLYSVLAETVACMDGKKLGAWACNVGRGSMYRSGGILFMKAIGVVAVETSADKSDNVEMGQCGRPAAVHGKVQHVPNSQEHRHSVLDRGSMGGGPRQAVEASSVRGQAEKDHVLVDVDWRQHSCPPNPFAPFLVWAGAGGLWQAGCCEGQSGLCPKKPWHQVRVASCCRGNSGPCPVKPRRHFRGLCWAPLVCSEPAESQCVWTRNPPLRPRDYLGWLESAAFVQRTLDASGLPLFQGEYSNKWFTLHLLTPLT